MDKKKNKLQNLRFLISGFVFLFAIGAIVSLAYAWFSSGRENDLTEFEMMAVSDMYEISSVANGSNGRYYNDYYAVVREQNKSDALVWQMTENANLNNYDENDDGIEPGSNGKISFVVTPKVDSIGLTFQLEVVGYVSGTGADQSLVMTEVARSDIKDYLSGHILMFKDYNNGLYSDLITSDENGIHSFDWTFNGKNIPTTISIYWIWPEHLSNLVNVYENNAVESEHIFLESESDSYNDVIQNICTYPQYYFWINATSETLQNLTEEKIINAYSTYGGLYDSADNEIGAGVDYLLVRMTVSEKE